MTIDYFIQDNPDFRVELEGLPVNAHFGQDLIQIELEAQVEHRDDMFYLTDEKGTQLMVAYLSSDDAPIPHEFEEGESLVVHRSASARDEDFMAKQEAGLHPMIVEKYDHGNVDYSIAGTKNYPDREWDVAPSGVYVPSDYVRGELDAGKISTEEVVRQANVALNIYSEYSNGNCYDCNVEVFEYNSEDAVWEQVDVHRGFSTGYEGAVAELKGLANALGKEFGEQAPELKAPVRQAHVPSAGPSL